MDDRNSVKYEYMSLKINKILLNIPKKSLNTISSPLSNSMQKPKLNPPAKNLNILKSVIRTKEIKDRDKSNKRFISKEYKVNR